LATIRQVEALTAVQSQAEKPNPAIIENYGWY
jgi:hypothetical protein